MPNAPCAAAPEESLSRSAAIAQKWLTAATKAGESKACQLLQAGQVAAIIPHNKFAPIFKNGDVVVFEFVPHPRRDWPSDGLYTGESGKAGDLYVVARTQSGGMVSLLSFLRGTCEMFTLDAPCPTELAWKVVLHIPRRERP